MPGGHAAIPLSARAGAALVLARVRDWLADHRLEAGLTLRMSAAGLVSFAIGHLLGLNQVYWAVLTAIVVMQSSIGGSLKAMIDRFAGTIGGAAWGVLVTLAVPHDSAVTTGVALAVALVPLAAAAAWRPGFRIAPVTAAIVLLAYSTQTGVVAAALQRVLEIGLGSVVALAVALLVSPARAHELLRAAGRDALSLMDAQIVLLLGGIAVQVDAAGVRALHDRIRAAVERAAAIAGEADRERRSYITEEPDPDPLVRTLRRLSNDLVMIGRALSMPLPDQAAARLGVSAVALGAAVAATFSGIGEALLRRRAPPELAPVSAARGAFETELAGLRRDRVTIPLPEEAVERIFGLAFGFEHLTRNLDELAARARELAHEH